MNSLPLASGEEEQNHVRFRLRLIVVTIYLPFGDNVWVDDGGEQSAGHAYGEGTGQTEKTGWIDGRSEGKQRKVDAR